MLAIDASRVHSALLNVWTLTASRNIGQLIRMGVLRTSYGSAAEYAELLQLRDWSGVANYYRHKEQMLELFPTQKGREVSLYFKRVPEVPGEEPFHVMERVLGPEGLRHWTAFLVLLTQNGRRGGIRWLVDDHLDAMGITKKTRRQRYRAVMFMDWFHDMHIKVEEKQGKGSTWSKLPLLLLRREFGHERGRRSITDGHEVEINPLLYKGVRQKSGKLGCNWWPQSAKVATINHKRYPHAYPLALQLPLRWRWHWPQKDHVPLSAAKLMDLAGIDHENISPSRVWDRLEKTLTVLNEVGALGDIILTGPPRNWETVYKLYPPGEQLARLDGQIDVEPYPTDIPLTGEEFTRWRETRRWSKARAARRLGVSRSTIFALEKRPKQTIPDKIRHRIFNL